MFKSKTTFIIGAGASREANLPIGSELTDHIAKLVNFHMEGMSQVVKGDPQIYHFIKKAVQQGGWENSSFVASGRKLAAAMALAPSIDTFLETHAGNREYELLGKLAIVRAITMAEGKSLLAARNEGRDQFIMGDLASTWYVSFAQQLFSGIPRETPEAAFKDITFVIFNYDRCVEIFLMNAIKTYFDTSQAKAIEIVKSINILRPYGCIGSVHEGDSDYTPFGYGSIDLLSAAARIKTYSESVDSGSVSAIRESVSKAETLIFLGFGFGDQNMDLIAPEAADYEFELEGRQVFGTAHRVSNSDVDVIKQNLASMLTGQYPWKSSWMNLYDGTCSELFNHYYRSLTAIRPKG